MRSPLSSATSENLTTYAAGRTEAAYTLYGFGNDVDWRLACLLEPLPRSEYCAYCVWIWSNMVMHPCCGVICNGFYAQRATSSYGCVLDAQGFRQYDVAVMVYSSQDLAVRQIRCSDTEKGCEVLGLSFQVLEHCHTQCA